MSARLAATDGPLKGQTFPLAGEITIGREAGVAICVADPAVSRHHCTLTCTGDRVRISDRNSRNGTFVNGLPVRNRALEHGDEIRIGKSSFVLLAGEDQCRGSGFSFAQASLDVTSTVQPERAEALCLSPAAQAAWKASPAGAGRIARTLVRASAAIAASHSLDELAENTVGLALGGIPAARCALLLYERWSPEPVAVYSRDQHGRSGVDVPVARSVADRVLREETAVLAQSAAGESGAGCCAVIAAPVLGRGRPLGLLYLESCDARVSFNREHLQLAAAVGVFSGAAIESARYLEWLRAETERLEVESGLAGDMIGESARMRAVQALILRAGPSDTTVLIQGETGTGKELVARALHRHSRRAARPFVAVNCAALTETLLESELFGHEKGAFTGAVAQKRGRIEIADGGSLFLDEIGELPLSLQPKLLRAIQEREFERVGGTRPIKVDVRLIAATSRDLPAAAAEKRFREDLYYRLNVVSVHVPPLRDRREDIPLLVHHFVAKFSKRAARPIAGISGEALACMLAYDWPGNVRELENAIERAIVLGTTDLILAEDLPESLFEGSAAPPPAAGTYRDAVLREKKQRILQAVDKAGGSLAGAAAILGLHPNYLHRLVTNLGLRDELKARASAASART